VKMPVRYGFILCLRAVVGVARAEYIELFGKHNSILNFPSVRRKPCNKRLEADGATGQFKWYCNAVLKFFGSKGHDSWGLRGELAGSGGNATRWCGMIGDVPARVWFRNIVDNFLDKCR
jgi:hypothetical protein